MSVDTYWEQIEPGAGAFDIVGDVHGCLDALRRLAGTLGYDAEFRHRDRKLAFVGDLINRGPDSVGVIRVVMDLVDRADAFAVLGNHDDALRRYLTGEEMHVKGDMAATVAAIDAEADHQALRNRIRRFLDTRPLILDLDESRLTVVHAGIEDGMRARRDAAARNFILNGEAIGRSPDGKTLRRDWARAYRGDTFVSYGHTPVPRAEIRFNTANVDTGAVRGGFLTALRWPERTTVSVPSGFAGHRPAVRAGQSS